MSIVNAFPLSDFQFLVYFSTVGVLVWALVAWAQRTDRDGDEFPRIHDPFQLAYLRGGARAALELAAYALLQKGLARAANDGSLRRTNEVIPGSVLGPVEEAVWDQLDEGCGACDAIAVLDSHPAMRELHAKLLAAGLIRGHSVQCSGRIVVMLGSLFLILLAASQITSVGPDAGMQGYLVLLATLFPLLNLRAMPGHLTSRGNAALRSAKQFCAIAQTRASYTDQAVVASSGLLLPSLYGLADLPSSAFPGGRRIFASRRAEPTMPPIRTTPDVAEDGASFASQYGSVVTCEEFSAQP